MIKKLYNTLNYKHIKQLLMVPLFIGSRGRVYVDYLLLQLLVVQTNHYLKHIDLKRTTA